MNFILQFSVLISASVWIYALNTQELVTSGYLKPWNFFDHWDYTLFIIFMWIVMFPFAGYFTTNRIGVEVLESKINKQRVFVIGLSVGLLFGLIVSMGLSNSFIGSIQWWKWQYSTLCLVVYGCLNVYTALRVWEKFQKLSRVGKS